MAARLLLAAAVALSAAAFTGTASAKCGPRTLIVCAVHHRVCETVEPHATVDAVCGIQP